MKESEYRHIVPSGNDKTLCGYKVEEVMFASSLGLFTDCVQCLKVAQEIIEKQKTKEGRQ